MSYDSINWEIAFANCKNYRDFLSNQDSVPGGERSISFLFDKDALQRLLDQGEQNCLMAFVCTDYSYKQIADKMYVGSRTVDGYREALFKKLEVKSKIDLAMFAIKSRLVNVHAKEM